MFAIKVHHINHCQTYVQIYNSFAASLTHWGRDKMAGIFQTQMHFLEWKCFSFHWNFTEVYSKGSSWQFISIGSDNALAPNSRQAIIWTNSDLSCWRIYPSLGPNGLTDQPTLMMKPNFQSSVTQVFGLLYALTKWHNMKEADSVVTHIFKNGDVVCMIKIIIVNNHC